MNATPPALWERQWRGVDVQVFDIGDESPLSLANAGALLNDEEKARARKFHFDPDRNRWMRSRVLLRLCLAMRLEINAGDVRFCCGVNGKPELSPGGSGPPLSFNLSHSGDFAAIAIGAEPVGVDIESWNDDLPVADLADHAFRPEESAAIRSCAEPRLLFYQLWTAKEAVMKCTGLGMSLPPASIQISGEPGGGLYGAARLDQEESFELFAHNHPGAWVLSAARRAS